MNLPTQVTIHGKIQYFELFLDCFHGFNLISPQNRFTKPTCSRKATP